MSSRPALERFAPDAIGRRTARAVRRSVRGQVRRWRNEPPLLSRTWEVRPPDFVGVGAQRSGTSWLYSMVEDHPDVHAQAKSGKELNFFERFWREPFTNADVARYHEQFRRPPGKCCGEWTPRYMFDPWTAPLLERAAPEARVLVALRDPVERFRSGLTHSLERGRPLRAATVDEALARGRYHEQLDALLRYFPRRQVLVLQFERCVAEPAATLRGIQSFLGLADLPQPTTGQRPVNHANIKGPDLAPELLAEVRARLAPDVERLVGDFPEISRPLWPNFCG